MKRILILFILLTIAESLFAQKEVLDRVIITIGNNESITLLEFNKRKKFIETRFKEISQTNLTVSTNEIIEKLLNEKFLTIIAKKKGIILPDDNKLLLIVSDEKLKEEINKNELFKSDYIGELRNQYILSRLINSDKNLKDYLNEEPKDEELKTIVDELFDKNKDKLKSIKASFILIALVLPKDLTLSQEKEIDNIFLEISNYVEKGKYEQATNYATKSLIKYSKDIIVRFENQPTTLQNLLKENIPIEFLNAIGGIKLDQKLPYPIRQKIGNKDYAFALKVISRKEEIMTKEEFKNYLLSLPEFKTQIMAKISEDRLKKWIENQIKVYGINVNVINFPYKINL
ncbi:MAG: hypothetical protein ACP5QP_03730 [Brevinematia bacterium]